MRARGYDSPEVVRIAFGKKSQGRCCSGPDVIVFECDGVDFSLQIQRVQAVLQ